MRLHGPADCSKMVLPTGLVFNISDQIRHHHHHHHHHDLAGAVRDKGAVRGDATREAGELRGRHQDDAHDHQTRRQIHRGRRSRTTLAPPLLQLSATGDVA